MEGQPQRPRREPDPLDRLIAEAQWPEPTPEAIRRLRDLWHSMITNPQRIDARTRRRKIMNRAAIFAAAAAILVCIWLGVSHITRDGPDTIAFAQTFERIEKAKNVTWKWTVYEHVTSKDGKRTWLKTETRQKSYKAPGLHRETFLDDKAQVREIEISDSVHRKRLQVFPRTREANFSEVLFGDPHGPFEWVKKELEDSNLQWVETRKTASGQVNVFRHAFRDQANGRDWSYDFWIDQKTKGLVEVHIPGADIYDPDKDPARGVPPEEKWSRGTAAGSIDHDIVFDANLDDSLFRLEPPEGYTVKTEHRGHVTEKEMIDYLGVLAEFNDKTFPDQLFPFDISSDRVNKAWDKPTKDRTPAEQKLVETEDYYIAKFYRMPTGVFVEDCTIEKSFRYLGKGVKLGDKNRIVCWYRLKGARTYRVLYGDLSVKDVAPKDLPLPVDR